MSRRLSAESEQVLDALKARRQVANQHGLSLREIEQTPADFENHINIRIHVELDHDTTRGIQPLTLHIHLPNLPAGES